MMRNVFFEARTIAVTSKEKEGQLTLPAHAVHVWHIPLSAAAATVDTVFHCLDQAEQQRARRLRFDSHRQHFILAHAAVRKILSRYTGVSPPAVQFTCEAQGKPQLQGSATPVQFNLSHSEAYALCAVTRDTPVGIDIEKIKPLPDFSALAQRFFAPAEVAQLQAIADAVARQRAFFRLWTAKEAVIKALGQGLAYPLAQVHLQLTGQRVRLHALDEDKAAAQAWRLYAFAPAADYYATLAVAAKIRCRRFFKFGWNE